MNSNALLTPAGRKLSEITLNTALLRRSPNALLTPPLLSCLQPYRWRLITYYTTSFGQLWQVTGGWYDPTATQRNQARRCGDTGLDVAPARRTDSPRRCGL